MALLAMPKLFKKYGVSAMKNIRMMLLVCLALFVQGAYAHDPAEHANAAVADRAGADCAAMQQMDMSTMAMNDPVMQAMRHRCMKAPGMHAGAASHDVDAMPLKKPSTGSKAASEASVQTPVAPPAHAHGAGP